MLSIGDLTVLGLKGLAAGAIVVAFAVAGEVLRPRGLAGVSSGAPSVALASLTITVLATGTASARDQALGMLVGAFALVVWCLSGVEAVKRFGARAGSAIATTAWLVVALGGWAAVLR